MFGQKIDSHVLRHIAADIIEKTAPDTGFPESEWPDLVTSLVRQWLTYDHNATLFPDENRQFYYIVKWNPLGGINIDVGKNDADWSGFVRTWKINPDDMPEAMSQLNRGQSAEVINGDGKSLRLYVNPEERSKGVEPEVKEKVPPGHERDLYKLASKTLAKCLGKRVDSSLREAIVRSVVEQWRRYDGHACVFIDENQQLLLKFEPLDDGGSHISTKIVTHNVGSLLVSLGLRPQNVSGALAKLNVGEEIEIQDKRGQRVFARHNPKDAKFDVRTPEAAPAPIASFTPQTIGPQSPDDMPQLVPSAPIFCPKCSAVLIPWLAKQAHQACAVCGETVSRG